MNGINKVIIVGTLGRDPETKKTTTGSFMSQLSIATSEQWTDKKSGQKQEKTEWHRVVLFGKVAEIAEHYLKKGRQVYIEGKLQTRKWHDQASGQERYSTEIVVDAISGVMQMLGSSHKAEVTTHNEAPKNNWNDQATSNQPTYNTADYSKFDDSVIPF